jgi:hypothetical protein
MLSSALARAERVLIGCLAFLSSLVPSVARADGEDPFTEPAPAEPRVSWPPAPARTPRAAPGYAHWLGGLYVGRGLRFNNPYRLRTVLGDDAESLSLGATFLTLHLGRTFSAPDTFEHGISGQLSIATDGIRQEVLTPAYLLVKRFNQRVIGYGRAGFPIVLEPDASVGLEAGLGSAYFFTANLGLGAQLDMSLFYGAATIEEGLTLIPVLSLSIGVFFDWEHLP